MEIRMTSAAFEAGGMIPIQYTCDGQDISPPLSWGDVPEGSASIALVCDDPDAPVGTWVHWVLFDLPPETRNLPENIPAVENLENGGRHGTNDWHKLGYGGPCPPGGTHRYYFKIYALDKKTGLSEDSTKAQLLKAMEGHILAEGELMGRYKR